MAGKVFFSVSMSLDGFIAPEALEELMGPQWVELQQWSFRNGSSGRNWSSARAARRGATTTSCGDVGAPVPA